jgi:hypothetical protein
MSLYEPKAHVAFAFSLRAAIGSLKTNLQRTTIRLVVIKFMFYGTESLRIVPLNFRTHIIVRVSVVPSVVIPGSKSTI